MSPAEVQSNRAKSVHSAPRETYADNPLSVKQQKKGSYWQTINCSFEKFLHQHNTDDLPLDQSEDQELVNVEKNFKEKKRIERQKERQILHEAQAKKM